MESKKLERIFFELIKENTLNTIKAFEKIKDELRETETKRIKTFKDIERQETLREISQRNYFINR